jgi:hypothetical protein
MKALTCVSLFVALALALPLRADDDGGNWIQNGDFVDGINHWYGGGRSPQDYANDNPLDANNPLVAKGLIVPLHPETWIKVAQDFKGKVSSGQMSITFTTSPDFSFSSKAEDYVNMPDKIGYDGWRAFNTPPGKWIVFLSDFGSSKGTYYEIPAKTGGGPQIYRALIKNMTPWEDKTITLAFPPGTGMLVVLNVSMTSTPGAQ